MSSFQMMRAMYQPKTSRDLLIDLGVGQYNATMLVETLMMAPATTEAAAAPTMLLVGHIQENLNAMGANLEPNGYIDPPTAAMLARLSGPSVLQKSWFEVARDVVAARRAGVHLAPRRARAPAKAVGAFDLPDVPGGMFTYAAAGFAAWYFLIRNKSKGL